MIGYRDLKRAEYAQGHAAPSFAGFDAGFAVGVSELIAGGRNV